MGMCNYEVLRERVQNLLDQNDWATAYTEIQTGIAEGKTEAMIVLAELYVCGVGVPQDEESAISLLKRAINANDGRAAFHLGQLYAYGNDNLPGFPKNEALGCEYFKKSAELNYPYGCAWLANAYYFGDLKFEENSTLAFQWATKAAKLGNEYGAELLGNCYEFGVGTSIEPSAAAHWYRQAAETGLISSKSRLGFVLSGLGKNYRPTQDMLEEGYRWACEAVEEGDVDAHVIVGCYFTDGLLGERDQEKGYYYIKLAADNGSEDAQRMLGMFRRNIYGQHYIP